MIYIKNDKECCGCYGCSNICPKQCISMKSNSEGFWYPKVDKSKCIECNLCVNVCPNINIPKEKEKKNIAYACKNKNFKIRESSSSGGIFTLLCEEIINSEGVVFGAAFDEDFNVRHEYAETLSECIKFKGSKYVQSKIGETYKIAKKFLEDGKVVLFSGTPCQIAGIDLYLNKKYENLFLIDIACHGVPSPLVYKQYINNLKRLNKSELKDIKFRDKSTGWKNYSVKFIFEKNTHKELGYNNIYMKGFLKDIYLRPSCYSCKFKKPITSADLTLADYWGVKDKHYDFDDDKGISLVLINSNKGEKLFKEITEKIELKKTDYNYAIKCNPYIVKPANYNNKRKKFFDELNEDNIEEVINKFSKLSFYERIKNKINVIINLK